MAEAPLFTDEQMDSLSNQLFMPLVLVVNYTLCEYLLVFYWQRRHQKRIKLLFFVSALGVLCLVPFARDDEDFVRGLNDVSESCVVVTFLIQITVIGYDLNVKFKIKSIKYLTHAAEVLLVLDLASVLLSMVFTFDSKRVNKSLAENFPNVCENITLAFIFVFRFYYIGISRGWRTIWTQRKVEVVVYLLFATHEMPFDVLESTTGLSWEHPQALWNRITITACLVLTARAKIRSGSSRNGSSKTTTITDKSCKETTQTSVKYASHKFVSKRLSVTPSLTGPGKVAVQPGSVENTFGELSPTSNSGETSNNDDQHHPQHHPE